MDHALPALFLALAIAFCATTAPAGDEAKKDALPRFPLADPPDVSGPDAGKKLFPATAEELIALADAAEKVFPQLVEGTGEKEKENALEKAILADPAFARLGANPVAVILFANLGNMTMFPDWDFSLMPSPGDDAKAPVRFLDVVPWLQYPAELHTRLKQHIAAKKHGEAQYGQVAKVLEQQVPAGIRFDFAQKVFLAFRTVKQKTSVSPYSDAWLAYLKQCANGDALLQDEVFKMAYESALAAAEEHPGTRLALNRFPLPLRHVEIARAWSRGLLPDEAAETLLLSSATNALQDNFIGNPFARALLERDAPGIGKILDKILDRVIDAESERKSERADTTGLALQIESLEGTRHFVRILAALCDPETGLAIDRHPRSAMPPDNSRNAVLNRLLRATRPGPGEDAAFLRTCLDEAGVPLRDYNLLSIAPLLPRWTKSIHAIVKHEGFAWLMEGPTTQQTPPPGFAQPIPSAQDSAPDMSPGAIQRRIGNLSGKPRQIADLLFDRIASSLAAGWRAAGREPVADGLLELIGWKNDMAPGDGFPREDSLFEAVSAVAGRDNAVLAQRMWERAPSYPFTGAPSFNNEGLTYQRFRSKSLGCLYVNGNIRRLEAFLSGLADGFDLEAFLEIQAEGPDLATPVERRPFVVEKKTFSRQNEFVPDYLGLLLDESDRADEIFVRTKYALAERLKKTDGLLSVGILVAGLLRSHRPDAHEHVAGLAIDPLIPEFHKDEILSLANQGSPDALTVFTKYLAKRYPTPMSVYMAASRWAGMDRPQPDQPFWGERGIELFFSFLSNRDGAYDRVGCTDAQLDYFALWALAQTNLDDSLHAAGNFIRTGSPVQRAQALAWASGIGNATLQGRLAMLALSNPENVQHPLVAATALHCLGLKPQPWQMQNLSLRLTREKDARSPEMGRFLLLTEEELQELERRLDAVAAAFPEGEDTYRGGRIYTYDDFEFFYSKKEVTAFREGLRKRIRQ